MKRPFLLALLIVASSAVSSQAVQQTSGAYYENDPTAPPAGGPATQFITGWATGWAQPANDPAADLTGWNYVGTVAGQTGGASGVYIGNGWVLTAAHVGPGTFDLDGNSYNVVTSSVTNVGSADLTLFQLAAPPALPNLTLTSSDPTAYNGVAGSSVAMLGYGGPNVETWGYNTVTDINFTAQVQGYTGAIYTTNDFLTATTTLNAATTNTAQLVGGDSGGGDFIFNAATGKWELAGINEIAGTYDTMPGDPDNPKYLGDKFSGFEQIDTYANQIYGLTGVPEPSTWLLIVAGSGAVLVSRRYRRRPASAA